jgi:hypothetical protein
MKQFHLAWLAFLAVSSGIVAGDGMIQLQNTPLTRMQILMGGGQYVDVPAGSSSVIGLFVVHSNECSSLVMPLAMSSSTSAGMIAAPSPYAVPGTSPGESVSLQIRCWPAEFGTNWCAGLRRWPRRFGETSVAQVTLGDVNSPATIWQTATGISPNRFKPLSIGMLSPGPLYFDVSDLVATEGTNGRAQATFTITRRYEFPPYSCCTNYPDAEPFHTADGTAVGASITCRPMERFNTCQAGIPLPSR